MGNICCKNIDDIELENTCLNKQIILLKENIKKKEKDLYKLKYYVIESKKQLDEIKNKMKDLV